MIIDTHRKFEKHFKHLPNYLKEKTIETIKRFSRNPFDPSLFNHPLHGHLEGKEGYFSDARISYFLQRVRKLSTSTSPQCGYA